MRKKKGSLDTIIKLLSYNLEVTGLSYENNLLQSKYPVFAGDSCVGLSFYKLRGKSNFDK